MSEWAPRCEVWGACVVGVAAAREGLAGLQHQPPCTVTCRAELLRAPGALRLGEVAPDPAVVGPPALYAAVVDGEIKNISLSDYKGKYVILFW